MERSEAGSDLVDVTESSPCVSRCGEGKGSEVAEMVCSQFSQQNKC